MVKELILDEYTKAAADLECAGARVEQRLREALGERRLPIHSITRRLKSADSLRYKLSRPDKTYESLWDVTDLVGLRVTTYFEDTIEEVARVVESVFDVDFGHSLEKRRPELGKFGYRSLHYVCALGLPATAKFEIQIRTVLQHAWAEIEHDLGYKSQDSVPGEIRHRFSRVASLLEVADEEFVTIRRALGRYRESAENTAQNLPVDRVTLEALARTPEIAALDERVAASLGKPIDDELFFPEYLIKMLELAGLRTTDDIRVRLATEGGNVVAIVKPYFEFAQAAWKLGSAQLDRIYRGYSLFFLAHLAVMKSEVLEGNKIGKLVQFYRELDYPHDEEMARRVATELIEKLRMSL